MYVTKLPNQQTTTFTWQLRKII